MRGGFAALMGGGSSSSADRQLELYKHSSPLNAAAGFNSLTVSGIEWRLFQTHTGRGKISGPDPSKQVLDHQCVRLWNRPNDFMTGNFFRQYSQLHLELTGLVYWVVVKNSLGIPVSMWPVKRTSMVPVPDPGRYLIGYVYLGPDNENIPLQLDEVIPLQDVDPTDPLGGVAPAEPLATDMESGRLTSQFKRNYFENSANPGGIIQLDNDTNLSDDEFEELSDRWAEQHRGVRNAHRVAIIERGKWVQNNQSLKDLMLPDLRQDDRNAVYEGYRVPKSMIGVTEDVNRANAEAAEYVYAKYQLVPKLNRIRDALNVFLLPMFQSAANGQYYWDYDNPIPKDWQADAETTKANAQAVAQLVLAGFDPNAAMEAISGMTIPWVGIPSAAVAQPEEQPQARAALPAGDSEVLRRIAAQLNTWGSM